MLTIIHSGSTPVTVGWYCKKWLLIFVCVSFFNLCHYDRTDILLLDLVPAKLALVGVNAQATLGNTDTRLGEV